MWGRAPPFALRSRLTAVQLIAVPNALRLNGVDSDNDRRAHDRRTVRRKSGESPNIPYKHTHTCRVTLGARASMRVLLCAMPHQNRILILRARTCTEK